MTIPWMMNCGHSESSWCLECVSKLGEKLKQLESFLHERCMHPDFEYDTTTGQRKAFDKHKPEGEGWESNSDVGRDGWERFEYHEEAYWRRRKTP